MRGRYREHCSSRVRASKDMGAGFPSGVNAPPPTPGGGLAPHSSSQVLCRPTLTSSELRPWRASGSSGKRKTLVKMVSHTLTKRGSRLVWRARRGTGESKTVESSGGRSVPNDGWGVYDDTVGRPFTSPTTVTSHTLHPDPEDRAEPHPHPHPQSFTLTACFFQSRQNQRNGQIKNTKTAMFLSQLRRTWCQAVSPGPRLCLSACLCKGETLTSPTTGEALSSQPPTVYQHLEDDKQHWRATGLDSAAHMTVRGVLCFYINSC